MAEKFVTVRGRRETVLEEIRVGGKSFPVLEYLGGRSRQVCRVFDIEAGPRGDFRAVHFLPRSPATEQRIELLRRLTQGNRNFPTVVGYVPERDRVAVIFEWVWGQNLARLLENIRAGKAARFSPFEAVKRMRSLAHAIGGYNSVTNLVHGDIKPANVIVTERPHNFVLVDFGSAWPVERTTRRQTGDGATQPYAAQELLSDNQAADFRADIFSHGVVLYELLTLKIPYGGLGGSAAKFDSPLALDPASGLSADQVRLPAALWRQIDAFLETALSIEPAGRFSDRGAWLAAIDEIDLEIRRRPSISPWQEAVAGVVARLFGRRATRKQ